MMLQNRVFLLKHQREFIKSKVMHTAIIGGYGSGKTQAGLYKLFTTMLRNNTDTAYYLPTHRLAEDICLRKMPEVLNRLGLTYKIKQNPFNITLSNGSTCMVRSMDNPLMIAGYEVGYSVIDEIDRMSLLKAKEAFESITARNRTVMKFDKNAVDFVCTPEGFKFLHEFFIKNPSPNKKLIKARTEENPFLPDDFILRLTETYDNARLKAYLDGEFVNMNQMSVYNNFKREINVKEYKGQISKPFIGMDFNITDMCAVVFVRTATEIHAIDQFEGFYNTDELCLAISQKYKGAIIYPDASGDNRHSNGNTDHQIIRSHGFNVYSNKKNPLVKDRVNEVNMGFKNKTLFVNPNCERLINALEQQAYKSNGEPEKGNGHDNIIDAFGYGVYSQKTNGLKQASSYVIELS
jgi:phage terminase large subunit